MSCSDYSGCSYTWQTSAFGACSQSCGAGVQSRTVWCERSDGTTVADAYCSGTKPSTSQSCTDYSTCTYAWQTGAWSACSQSCGGGTQTRSVSCARSDGASVSTAYCSGSTPATSQSCNTAACSGAGPTCVHVATDIRTIYLAPGTLGNQYTSTCECGDLTIPSGWHLATYNEGKYLNTNNYIPSSHHVYVTTGSNWVGSYRYSQGRDWTGWGPVSGCTLGGCTINVRCGCNWAPLLIKDGYNGLCIR